MGFGHAEDVVELLNRVARIGRGEHLQYSLV